jgi:16S rRNA G966 N2-methylase RsmD
MPTNYLSRIVDPDVQDYLFSHEGEDERALVLKHKDILGLPASVIAQQLAGRRKSKLKLPAWHQRKQIIYPPTVNLEQCSSEATALFKASLAGKLFLQKTNLVAVDLTGGFGVDSYFLSTEFQFVHYVEPTIDLFEIAQNNHKQLGATSVIHHCTTAEKFIESSNHQFDLIYLDPGRRDQHARKVFKLADCSPDVSKLQHQVFKKSHYLLVKTSPLLDIQQGLREILHVKKVYVISVDNECKELLFLAENNYQGKVEIEAVDLTPGGNVKHAFAFSPEEEKNANIQLGEPSAFLYEPNSAILKSGAFKLIAQKFQLIKLAPNTHLYTSSELIANFPGRTFQIEFLDPDPKQLKHLLPSRYVNVMTRNYPLKPEELKKKLKLIDGGEKYLIGFSDQHKNHLAFCHLL